MKSFILSVTFFASFFVSSSQQNQFETIFDQPQIINFKSTLRYDLCNNKAYIPIDLPPNAKGWIYSIEIIRKSEMQSPKNTLLSQVKGLSENHQVEQIADFVVPQGNKNDFNLYILQDRQNADSFYQCGSYKYVKKYIHTTSKAGYIENNKSGTYFIGIESIHDLKGLRLKVEAVAVI